MNQSIAESNQSRTVIVFSGRVVRGFYAFDRHDAVARGSFRDFGNLALFE